MWQALVPSTASPPFTSKQLTRDHEKSMAHAARFVQIPKFKARRLSSHLANLYPTTRSRSQDSQHSQAIWRL
ncbi:hypothetical protein VTN00DRAFT_4556 [Thermoascus crustaceus]|uniref:uncharacterized protein n=1 Tax=Thermoascus crustaceus TaxID=5088 RepID=UPI0037423FE9